MSSTPSREASPTCPLHVEMLGAGEPIVLVHGFGNNGFTWRQVVSHLGEGYRALLIDLKGFGASPKPIEAHYSIEDQSRLVSDCLEHLGVRGVTLIGHSLGGAVALWATLRLQDQAPGLVRALVLVDSVAHVQRPPWFIRVLQIPGLGYWLTRLAPKRLQIRRVLATAYHNPSDIQPETVEAYATPLTQPGAVHALVQTAKLLSPTAIAYTASMYERIRVPTLLIWGRHDTIVPLAIGERLRSEVPGARLVVLEDCGHVPQEERPAQTAQLIRDFLVEHSDRSPHEDRQ